MYQRVMEIKQQMEAERRAEHRARTEVTFGEVLEALLHHWDATEAMVRDAKAGGTMTREPSIDDAEEAWAEWRKEFPDYARRPKAAFEAGWDYGWNAARDYFAEGGSFK